MLRRKAAMRLHHALILVALGVLVAGCSARSTLAPDSAAHASASRGATFVLESITDSRLPAPGTATVFVTDAERGRPPAAPAARGAASLAQVPDAVDFGTLPTEPPASGPRLPPPLYSRAYAYVHAAIYDAVSLPGDGRRGNISQ